MTTGLVVVVVGAGVVVLGVDAVRGMVEVAVGIRSVVGDGDLVTGFL